MSHVTPEELDVSLRRVKKYVDDNVGSGSGGGSGGSVVVDDALSGTSENPVQNKVVKSALDEKADMSDIPDVSGLALKSEIPDVSGFALKSEIPDVSGFALTEDIPDISGKQDALTFDTTPTQNSLNPVTSGGVYTALQNISGGGSGGSYQLPIASQSVLGGIKVGAGLGIDSNGILYVVGSPKSEGRIVLSTGLVELDPATRSATVQILDSTGDIVIESSSEDVTFTLVGATISVTGVSANSIAVITVTSSENGLYSEASASFYVGVPIVTWADGDYDEISAMLNAHYNGKINIYDYWNIGDERTISLSAMSADGVSESHIAQDVTLVLVAKNNKDLVSGGKCAFVWQQKEILASSDAVEAGYINPTSTNINGWDGCARRTWCNNVYYNALPAKFKGLVKECLNLTTSGNKSAELISSNDKIFLPSWVEVGFGRWVSGSTIYATDSEGSKFDFYQYTTGNGSSSTRLKGSRNNPTSYLMWWLRSPCLYTNNSFIYVNNSTGVGSYIGANSLAICLALCGCI